MALSKETRELISKLADAVRNFFEIEIPIEDIETIVDRMGGTIVVDNSLDGFSDGRIRKTGETSFEIRVSPYQSIERRNFTIAHELGHLFLHMGYMTNEELWKKQDNQIYNRKGISEGEYFANEFAAAFLMPEMEYRKVMNEHTEGTTVYTKKIAEFFNVSIDAAANRGKWLGYLQW